MNGQRLRSLRKAKKMKQIDLAAYLNVAKSSISMYENDKNQPDNATLIMLGDLFNVSVDYLLGRTDVPHMLQNLKNTALLGDEVEKLTSNEAVFLKESLMMYRRLQKQGVDPL